MDYISRQIDMITINDVRRCVAVGIKVTLKPDYWY